MLLRHEACLQVHLYYFCHRSEMWRCCTRIKSRGGLLRSSQPL